MSLYHLFFQFARLTQIVHPDYPYRLLFLKMQTFRLFRYSPQNYPLNGNKVYTSLLPAVVFPVLYLNDKAPFVVFPAQPVLSPASIAAEYWLYNRHCKPLYDNTPPFVSITRHLFYPPTYGVNPGNRHSYKAVGFPATGADALRVYIQRLGFLRCCLRMMSSIAPYKRGNSYYRQPTRGLSSISGFFSSRFS